MFLSVEEEKGLIVKDPYANASRGASHLSMRKVSRQRGGYQGNNPYCDRCCKHHAYRNCPAFDKICDACGQKGHFKRSNRCPGYRSQRGAPRGVGIRRPRGRFRGHGNVRSQRQSNVNYVRDDSQRNENVGAVEDIFEQCTIQDVFTAKTNDMSNSDSEWNVTLHVRGQKLQLELDTGARCNVLSKATAEKFTSDFVDREKRCLL